MRPRTRPLHSRSCPSLQRMRGVISSVRPCSVIRTYSISPNVNIHIEQDMRPNAQALTRYARRNMEQRWRHQMHLPSKTGFSRICAGTVIDQEWKIFSDYGLSYTRFAGPSRRNYCQGKILDCFVMFTSISKRCHDQRR
jgi:hypothetical protein